MDMTEKSNILYRLYRHPLFEGCAASVLTMVASAAQVQTFAVGAPIKGETDTPLLCVILEGEATVHTRDEHNDLLLRILRPGDTFGVATLFGHSPTVTRITALKSSTALCIDEDVMRRAICADGALAMRYIEFLSDRIRFLNRRIATLSAGSAERRLAAWLDAVIPPSVNEFSLPLPLNRLADTLGVGRASLYRAFDELTLAGYLIRDGKTVRLSNRDAMQRDYSLC